ncbi:hypothetical protein MATR_27270 [Marivirga tractuosa]|uniref:Cadherin n=1 Tax=Marivirga tractuosa (strain ATCC 23168 / DSM 4126 / NBRC 15989 / NCIMB 1408 / VKM B-1430 / H-43) TaxID=643867 RepID=E4TMI9_MARTH|nr:T9SS type A sorting domain-containing protein [Marivirga tractuosa]ADR23423.1 Cadherin [Marivirga tractuosa DSM 4126]BDD15902.1 hypothetical protein MATR_27270 [Marivirga tractuosa]
MKRLNLILLLLLTAASAFAQINFKQVPPPAPAPQIIPAFEPTDEGDIAYADVDGINGLDVLITGSNNANDPIAKLYINDGNGNYTEKTGTPFIGVTESSVTFADIDGNGSQDVVISGLDNTSQPITKLYTNDGDGNFTEDATANFEGVRGSEIAFADLDGVNGPDLLISGLNASSVLITNLYLNDGSGSFTTKSTIFKKITRGSIAFADVDGDNDLDVALSGNGVPAAFPNQTPAERTEIYLNDGSANFTLLSGTPFEGLLDSDLSFEDVDDNNSQDLLISGSNSSNQPVTKLYINDGSASFTESSEIFDALKFSAVAFADVNSANGPDLLISGTNSIGDEVTRLYLNDGSGGFPGGSGSFTNISNGSVAFLDIDGDASLDLIISGKNSSGNPITEIYANDGTGVLTLASGTPFEGVFKSAAAFADVDNDGNQDVIITGDDNANNGIAKLYSNDGSNNFTEVSGTPFAGVETSAIAFANVDGANGPDVLISGLEPGFPQVFSTKLYLNDGSGNFGTPTSLTGLNNGSIAFADIQEDNNNDLDVVITGANPNESLFHATILYTNNGDGTYTEVAGTPFEDVINSSIAFADMDGENGPDLIISGENSSGTAVTILYINDGNGSFSASGQTFDGVKNGAIAVGDTDGDGSLDLLITGNNVAKLYTNDGTVGNPTFTEVAGTPFSAVNNSAAKIADIDGINGNDIIISGDESGQFTTKLYVNDGSGNFSEIANLPLTGVSQGDLSLADTDNDGLLDILITGRNQSGRNISYLYKNLTDFVPPSITSAATASVDENETASFYTATADEEVTFTLGDSKDEAFFNISADEISFKTAPDFETPQDANNDNIYLIDLIATDQGGNEVTQEVAITVLDVDESGPTITSAASVSVEENITGTVYTATADVSATFTLGNSKDEALFTISTDAISFNDSPDFEAPADANEDNVYELDLIATDGDGFATTKALTITVTDVDESGPTITSATSVSVEENINEPVYTATADVTATFTLGSSKDESLFTISSGVISFNSSPDFEAPSDANEDNVYELDLTATGENDFSTTAAITITVTDVDESGPSITSAASVSVEENVTGTVYTATADVSATFTLGSSKDEGLFTISTDAISFNAAPDFETPADDNGDNVYELDLIATDENDFSTTKAITITVTDIDESGPVITSSASVSVEENVTGTVYTATADVSATFTLGSSKDESLFTISTDAISFNAAPDFETPADANEDNVYELDLIATDGDGFATTKAISITVTDIDESGPTITSEASASVEENVTGTVYTATADVSATFTLGNSKDENLFTISTDAISFNAAPDFETPADANEDNVYELDLIATDGDGFTSTKAISITVTDVDESGPSITSSESVSVEENSSGTVYTATADVTATFALGSDKDEALFTISTDAISFNAAPDFEAPADANEDNVYELDLIATDENGFSSTTAITITVTDVEEEPLSIDSELLSKVYPNPVQNTLFIQPLTIQADAEIFIYNTSGTVIEHIKYDGQEQKIDVSEFNPGVYVLIIKSNTKQMQLKFIKE